jgi:hypothetical protein
VVSGWSIASAREMAALSRDSAAFLRCRRKKGVDGRDKPAMTLKSQLDVTGICFSRTNREMMKK